MPRQSKILIVDDNPTNVEILEKILGDDYQLATAATGEETLEIAPAFQPALILLDIMMPGIDGYETCRRLRATPTLRATKIMMVSAKAMVEERLQGYEAGASDYLTKPYNNHELRAKVRASLQQKHIEALDQLKSAMLSRLSHEIRTPLNGIIPILEMLMSEENMTAEERREMFAMMRQSATRLLGLFEKAMTLCTMRAGTYDFHVAPDDLCSIVRDAVCALTSRASVRHVQLHQALPDAAPTTLDRAQMTDVVAAILDNAVRFSPPEACVSIKIAHDDDYVCLTITDQGVGIDPSVLPRVFEEFTQADMTHHTEGQGLSLTIARQIVLAHNGTIEAESTEGSGTTVTVRLPVAAPCGREGKTIGVGPTALNG